MGADLRAHHGYAIVFTFVLGAWGCRGDGPHAPAPGSAAPATSAAPQASSSASGATSPPPAAAPAFQVVAQQQGDSNFGMHLYAFGDTAFLSPPLYAISGDVVRKFEPEPSVGPEYLFGSAPEPLFLAQPRFSEDSSPADVLRFEKGAWSQVRPPKDDWIQGGGPWTDKRVLLLVSSSKKPFEWLAGKGELPSLPAGYCASPGGVLSGRPGLRSLPSGDAVAFVNRCDQPVVGKNVRIVRWAGGKRAGDAEPMPAPAGRYAEVAEAIVTSAKDIELFGTTFGVADSATDAMAYTARYDGSAWKIGSAPPADGQRILAAARAPDGTVWVVTGDGEHPLGAYRRDTSGTWTAERLPKLALAANGTGVSIWARTAEDVWLTAVADGNAVLLHRVQGPVKPIEL